MSITQTHFASVDGIDDCRYSDNKMTYHCLTQLTEAVDSESNMNLAF